MRHSLSDDQARMLRIRAQRLVPLRPGPAAGPAHVVKDICGVQDQDPAAGALAVRARAAGLTVADVERARVQDRSVVRTWCMRGTLHLLAAEDLGWLQALLGPLFIRSSRRRYAELGLSEETCVLAVRTIRDALAERGPLTRAELVAALAARGIRAEGQAAPHLLRRAALEGVVCFGPDRDGKPTYVLQADWLDPGPTLPPGAAQAELARRYLEAYGPADQADLAAWSGLPIGEARAAWACIADQLMEVEISARPAWMLRTHVSWLDGAPERSTVVRLLPSFDPYLLGYRSRALAVAPEHEKRIHPGGGLLRPTLLVGGRVLGTWRIQRHRDRLDVVVAPLDNLAPDVHPGLEAEVAGLAHFFGMKASLSVIAPS